MTRRAWLLLLVVVAAFAVVAVPRQAAAEEKPIVACATTCASTLPAGAREFKLKYTVDSCDNEPAEPRQLRFVPSSGDATTDVGTCTKTGAAGGVRSYDCKLTQTVTEPGHIETSICDSKSVKINTASLEAAKRRQQEGNAVASQGLPFLPMDSWREAINGLGLPLAGHSLGHYYDQKNDVVVLFVDAEATPFFALPDIIDEDDDIYVAVVDYEDRLRDVKIAIQGCNRPPVEPRIYGGSLTDAQGDLKSLDDATLTPKPKVILRAFGKCAGAAAGGPSISVQRDKETQKNITVPVNPLYRLSVGVGFGYDATETNTFTVQAPAGSSLTRVAESEDKLGVTPLVYVAFYPIARDFRKTSAFWQRSQLFVGMGTKDFPNNLTVGAGFELTMGLNVLVGWHALTKEKVLAEGSGLHDGSSFDGTTDSLPLEERWATGSVFLGFGLSSDLFARLR